MRRAAHQSFHYLATFSFPAISQGRGVMVLINRIDSGYGVQIDNELIAEIAFDENRRSWQLTHGDLADPDLVKEIGERIEAKYN